MAVVNYVLQTIPGRSEAQAQRISWSGMGSTDSGQWLQLPWYIDRSVHVYGTFPGTISIQGSNENATQSAGPTAGVFLHDGQGTTLAFTTAGFKPVGEPSIWIRPVVTASGTTSCAITVDLLIVAPPTP